MQTALWWECRRILSSDVLALRKKQIKLNKKAQHLDGMLVELGRIRNRVAFLEHLLWKTFKVYDMLYFVHVSARI